MMARILLFLIAILPFSAHVEAGVWDNLVSYFNKPAPQKPPSIRILVVHDQNGVVLEVKGKYHLYDPHANEHISTRFIGKRKFIQALSDGLKWGEAFPGIHQLLIIPDDPSVTTVVDGIEYRGSIYVYDIGGAISIVNEVNIEDYLNTMLTPKYTQEQPAEFLAAVAIAARTNAYYQTQNPKTAFWAVDANQVGYKGFAVTNMKSDMAKAIQATRYMIMKDGTDSAAKPFLAQWDTSPSGNKSKGALVVARISLAEAETMAQNGDHAAQILAKAFPDSSMQLMHYSGEPVE